MRKSFLTQISNAIVALTLAAFVFMPIASYALQEVSNEAQIELIHDEVPPENDSIEQIQKTASSKQEEIERLKKLKDYYESSIRRLSRTAWRLEFKDPGYSRILDQRVAQLQKKLDAVNKRLNELQ